VKKKKKKKKNENEKEQQLKRMPQKKTCEKQIKS